MEYKISQFSSNKNRPNMRPQTPKNETGGVNKEIKQESFLKKSQDIIVEILKNSSNDYGDLFSQFVSAEQKNDMECDILDLDEELKISYEESLENRMNSEISFLGIDYIEMLYEDFKKTGKIDVESFPFAIPPDLFFIKYNTFFARTEKHKQFNQFLNGQHAPIEIPSWQKAGQEIISKLTEYWNSLN